MTENPKIIISNENPGEPLRRPAAEFVPDTRLHVPVIIGTRPEIEEKIKASVAIPLELQELLLKLNSLSDANSTHFRVVAHAFPHNGGFDFGGTISRIA
jgi:hypothetical protein